LYQSICARLLQRHSDTRAALFRLKINKVKTYIAKKKQTSQHRGTETQRKSEDKEQAFFAVRRGSLVKPCFTFVLRGFDLFVTNKFHQRQT
jgi:hypothetical protein